MNDISSGIYVGKGRGDSKLGAKQLASAIAIPILGL
ncbi:hypothetical protein SLEP1_g59895 [Rubroshorea leprosula]|uniref:Uncharacterized protein n=1 Tax=Rubroshorea leprosula TaxID=152421 RepID=A0AAV5MUS9_9ROSI|nr:hypothetical protein SLEP1_g59895 [Rubroshorea leprosula]